MRAWSWPVAVVLILAITVAGNVWVAVMASADPSFAIEEDYYRRAVQYDLTAAQQARSDRLRWTVDLSAGPAASAGAPVTVVLRDSTGVPVSDATVRVRLRRVARSQQSLDAQLDWVDGGRYRAIVPMHDAGLWDITVEGRRGPDRFFSAHRLDLAVVPSP